ncbi:hypothetical protein VB773_06095 [Haloarculaceae archaeon H-GB2-1]|nr:hypothetical protein [Haloarculaceae archaeon H-GB1-1]MEA5407188.1 hypothetical protein [Haloarculaceae archaeon H-GB2-1]
MSESLAKAEQGPESGHVPPKLVDDVRVSLYHVHLPKLDDADVVRFDADRSRLSRGPNFDVLFPYLRFASEHEARSHLSAAD